MSPGRPIIAAAQVVVVGVLIAIVYTNFLRPGGDGALSGVDAPGSPEVTQSAEPRPDRSSDRAGNGAGAGVAGGAGAGGEGVTAAEAVIAPSGIAPAGAPAPGGLGPTDGTPDSTDTGPTDDQYLDAVARLTIKVN